MENKFKEYVSKSGIKEKKIYDTLNVNVRTWKSRLEKPRSFTLDELEVVSRVLRTPIPDLLEIILN